MISTGESSGLQGAFTVVGGDDLSATTPKQIVAWTRELAEPAPGGRGLTPLMISDGYLAAARSFFAWAKGTQVIPANPCDGLSCVPGRKWPSWRGSSSASR